MGSPLARSAAVPALALQPLVENAIVHGTSWLTGAGQIRVTALVRGSALELTVVDNGPGPSAPDRKRGTGIANLRERLSRLYGAGATLTLTDGLDGGAVATLMLP